VLFASGLRRREAGTLLTVELPDTTQARRYYSGRIAAAVAKHSDRSFYISAAALKDVATLQAQLAEDDRDLIDRMLDRRLDS
jgi:hypothetical protein